MSQKTNVRDGEEQEAVEQSDERRPFPWWFRILALAVIFAGVFVRADNSSMYQWALAIPPIVYNVAFLVGVALLVVWLISKRGKKKSN